MRPLGSHLQSHQQDQPCCNQNQGRDSLTKALDHPYISVSHYDLYSKLAEHRKYARAPIIVNETIQIVKRNDFAQAITRLERYRGDDGLRDGTMLAWAFTPEARAAAQLLREREELALGMVRLEQVALESNEFRAHIASRSTERGDYSEFLTFVQPPQVEITHQRVRGRTYDFSAAGTQIYNVNAQLSNVQWDFDHRDNRFIANRDTWFGKRTGKGKNAQPPLDAQHTFPHSGTFTVACKVQDDTGGEALGTIQLRVS